MIHGNDIHSLPDGAFKDLTSLQVLCLKIYFPNVEHGESMNYVQSCNKCTVTDFKTNFITIRQYKT